MRDIVPALEKLTVGRVRLRICGVERKMMRTKIRGSAWCHVGRQRLDLPYEQVPWTHPSAPNSNPIAYLVTILDSHFWSV